VARGGWAAARFRRRPGAGACNQREHPRPARAQERDLEPTQRSTLAAGAHLHLVFDGDAVALQPDEDNGLSFLAAALLLIIRDAQRDGSWDRLKACRNPDCHWAYYDRSHAARGAWCDMAVCGNRMKNRTLRSRRSARTVRTD
jgi:predicted RNA-binding Zn ribbon-like protein